MAKRKRNRTRKIKPFTILQKTYMIAGVLILAGMITVYGSAMIVLKGPSVTVSNLLTSTMMETRTLKSIARLFFSEEEMETIMNRNSVSDTDEITDSETDFVIDESKKDKIEIIDIKGPTYEGKLMIVYDPSRIHLAVNSDLGNSNEGYFVEEYVKANDAIAGINAGGFDDPNGQGTGGIPYGIVIQDGELVSGGLDDYNSVIGFNEQNKLIVGNMTGRQALEYGLRDAVTFKPIFIVNYVPVEVTGTGGGVIRDVLAGDMPSMFMKRIYITASLLGAVTYICLLPVTEEWLAMLLSVGLICLVRALASRYRWNLPRAKA